MYYRLGHFLPKPGSGVYEYMFDVAETAEPMLQVLEEMLQVRLSRSLSRSDGPSRTRPEELTDLLEVLPSGHPDASWVKEVYESALELDARITFRLLACEYEPGSEGFLCVAGTSPTLAGVVRSGDWVQAGFVAFREGEASVRVSSRAFRVVCCNGSIVSVSDSEEASGVGCGERVARCFDPESFGIVLERLKASARELWRDLMDDEGYRLHRKFPGAIERALPARIEQLKKLSQAFLAAARPRRASFTTWDAVNAITEIARDIPDWRVRLDLEEIAGRLAMLRKPIPRRRPAIARELQEA